MSKGARKVLPIASAGSRGRLQALVQQTAPARPTLRLRHDQIRPDPEQPRTQIDRRKLADLAKSIKEHGVLQPVLVRESGGDPPYFLVSGERRWRAAKLAGLEELDAVLDEREAKPGDLRIRQLVENIQRDDLELLDTARALEALIEAGVPARALAKRLGKSPSFVSQHLAATKADGLSKAALEEGHLKSAETLRLFDALPETAKSRLLEAARSTHVPIGRGQVEAVSKPTAKKKPPKKTGRPALYSRRFRTQELRALIVALGGSLPRSNRELGEVFDALVRAMTKSAD